MSSLFLPKKYSGSLAFSLAGLKGSSLLMILMSGSGTGALAGSGRAEMVIGKGSSAAGNSCCDRMFEFLQA